MTSSVDALLPLIRAEFSKLRIPTSTDKVHKDECMVSFDSPYSPGGLYVSLSTFQGFGADFVSTDVRRNGGTLYLRLKYTEIRREPTPSSEVTAGAAPAPTKLAINVEGGFQAGAERFEVTKQHFLAVWTGDSFQEVSLPHTSLPEFVSNVCEGIIQHNGMRIRAQADSWDGDKDRFESKYAAGLALLDNGKKISNDPKTWRCEMSGDDSNLWLNLSTGYIGGGRKQWDGSGGSGGALQHFIDTGRQYPLCVKLGTITPHGADIWSYAEDEDTLVLDSKLAEHLRHWGIDIMGLEKTEKSLIEMEAELNASYDWTRIMEGGGEAVKLTGAGHIGFKNIGSSCYMNSVLQAIFTVPEFRAKYTDNSLNLIESCSGDPSQDLPVQLSKLGHALFTDRYAAPLDNSDPSNDPEMQKYVVAPYMFKHLVGKNHREFSSGRQQDASEYFQFLLDSIERSERINTSRLAPTAAPTNELFQFEFEKRLQCEVTGKVRYVSGRETLGNTLELQIPLELARPKILEEEEKEAKRLKTEGDSSDQLEVPFEACLQRTFATEVVQITNSDVASNGGRVNATMSTKFKHFPKYLLVTLVRYYVDAEWKQKKIDAAVKMPEELDLTVMLSAGVQPGEEILSNGSESSTVAGVAVSPEDIAAKIAAEDTLTMELVSMGFSENGCRRAVRNTASSGGDMEVALNWVLEHMGDPDFDAPIETLSATPTAAADEGTYDAGAIEMLMSFGDFTENRVKRALRETGGDAERAADWLFSHMGDDEADVTPAISGGDTGATSTEVRGDGRYKLIGVISHMGKNTEHGHYVCHLWRNGKWVLYNDDKVSASAKPPLEYGFMYLYGPRETSYL